MKASALLVSLLSALAVTLPTTAPPSSYPRTLRIRQDWDQINEALALILDIFPLNVALKDAQFLLSTAEGVLATAFGITTSETSLSAYPVPPCADLTIIYARGTTEPGNVGVLVGPWFFDTVEEKLGGRASVGVQGVEYPATVDGYLEGNSTGTVTMANYVITALTRCPDTKVVMSGYSQGAQVVHNAAAILPAAMMARVSSVVTFGDPKSDEQVQGAEGKTLVLCNPGDNICDGGAIILAPHITYVAQVGDAASFVLSKAGY